jgi:hypothetical protein
LNEEPGATEGAHDESSHGPKQLEIDSRPRAHLGGRSKITGLNDVRNVYTIESVRDTKNEAK